MLANFFQALLQFFTGYDDWTSSEFHEGYARARRGEDQAEDLVEHYNPFRAIERREVRLQGFKAGHLEKTLDYEVQQLRKDLP